MKKLYKIRLIIAGIIGILSILAFCGVIYPVKILDIQFVALLQRSIIDFSWIALGLFIGIIIITLLFGRLYCSTICPFGILQEFAALLFRRKNSLQKNFKFKYIIAALTFGALLGGSALFIRYIDPYTIFGSAFSLSLFGLIFTLVILALVFFKNRWFCTNICPIGTVLGLISKISLNKIHFDKEKCVSCSMCSKICPSGCIDFKNQTVDNETCVKCLKCIEKCPKGAIKYGIEHKKVTFNPKRRELIWAASALIILGGALKAGVELGKNIGKNIRNIILPPGSENPSRMLNKCLNCNLCIESCPNKILVKSDKDFGAVHIDYSKGEGFCKYDCNNCSNVCPSGAIKRITKEEKQQTRIAMAVIKDNCAKCGKCIKKCPTNAISRIDDKIVIDSTKCIGCATCTTACRINAIEIFSINEQGKI